MSTEIKTKKACEKANLVCDKSQYNEATLWGKIKLTIHLAYCRNCRKYSNNNHKLTTIMHNAKVECMHKNEKEVLKENLTQVIKEHQN